MNKIRRAPYVVIFIYFFNIDVIDVQLCCTCGVKPNVVKLYLLSCAKQKNVSSVDRKPHVETTNGRKSLLCLKTELIEA